MPTLKDDNMTQYCTACEEEARNKHTCGKATYIQALNDMIEAIKNHIHISRNLEQIKEYLINNYGNNKRRRNKLYRIV